MADLERENYLVEITPISNDNGEITKYFIFAKKSAPVKQKSKVEFENNKSEKLLKFYGKTSSNISGL